VTNYFEIEFSFHPTSDPDLFDDFLDRVVDELAKIGRESDVTATLARARASFTMPVENLSDEALIGVLSDLRTALHAADCGTPGWPSHHEVMSTRGIGSRELTPA